MSADPFHLNRPVHLARRDACYLKAVERINRLPSLKKQQALGRPASEILYLLRESRRHAKVANLSGKTSDQSVLFEAFLDVAVDSALSLNNMIHRRDAILPAGNPIDRFLGADPADGELATRYARCITQLVKGLGHMVHRGENAFDSLRKTSVAKMAVADKSRYEKAFRHFMDQANQEAAQAIEFPEIAVF